MKFLGTELFNELKEKNADFEAQKIALQDFYNKDKGKGVQDEVVELLKGLY